MRIKAILGVIALLAGLTAALVSAGPASAHAGHPVAGISVSPSGQVSLGGSVLVTGTITDQHTGAAYTSGTVDLEYKQGGPDYTSFASGTPNGSGQFAASLDVTEANGFGVTVGEDGILGTDDDNGTLNLRVIYTNGVLSDQSSVIELDIIEGAECNDGLVHLSEPAVTGTGIPAPGSTHGWTFSLQVQNCTGVTLSGVKVQGGTSGWTALNGSPTASTGILAVKQNKKTAVITWTGDLADQQSATITIPVTGTVGSTCGAVQHLSGAWSAAYRITEPGPPPVTTSYKTDYTGRAFVEVTCA